MTELTKMKIVAIATVLFALTLGAVAMWAYNRGKWQGRVDDLKAQIAITDSVQAQYVADSAQWALAREYFEVRDSTLTADSARIASTTAQTRQRYLQTRAELTALQNTMAQDSISPQVRVVLGAYEQALAAADSSEAACQEGKTNAEDRVSNCEQQLAVADSSVLALEKLRGRLTAERDSAVVLLKPPPLFALTFDVGVGAACVYNSQITCGPSIHVTVLRFRIF